MLTKEEMLSRSRRAPEEVPVQHWGGDTVYMRGMSGAERNSLLLKVKDDGRSTDKKFVINQAVYAHELIARCLCNEGGQRLFSDSETHMVGEFPPEVLDELLPVAQRLSGLDGEESAEKNS